MMRGEIGWTWARRGARIAIAVYELLMLWIWTMRRRDVRHVYGKSVIRARCWEIKECACSVPAVLIETV